MFTVIFHDEAESELSELPAPLRAKMGAVWISKIIVR